MATGPGAAGACSVLRLQWNDGSSGLIPDGRENESRPAFVWGRGRRRDRAGRGRRLADRACPRGAQRRGSARPANPVRR